MCKSQPTDDKPLNFSGANHITGTAQLVNAYEGKAGMVYLQVKLSSVPERFEIHIVYKWRYINTLPFLSFTT